MRSEIRSICKDHGLTGVYVTHDQEEALSMADRLAVLSEGRIQQMGAPSDVYRNPVNQRVAEFMGETNILDVPLDWMEEQNRKLGIRLGSSRFSLALHERIPWRSNAGRLRVSIRPEAFSLTEGRGDRTSLAAVVTDVSYLGATLAIRVALEDQSVVKVVVMNPSVPLIEPGARLNLTLLESDIVPLCFSPL